MVSQCQAGVWLRAKEIENSATLWALWFGKDFTTFTVSYVRSVVFGLSIVKLKFVLFSVYIFDRVWMQMLDFQCWSRLYLSQTPC